MLNFAKHALAAVWAFFAPSFVNDLACFDIVKHVLAAVWAGFAPSGLVEASGWIRPNRVLAAAWARFAPNFVVVLKSFLSSRTCSGCSLGMFCAEPISGKCTV